MKDEIPAVMAPIANFKYAQRKNQFPETELKVKWKVKGSEPGFKGLIQTQSWLRRRRKCSRQPC
jgi:hypothetical protein